MFQNFWNSNFWILNFEICRHLLQWLEAFRDTYTLSARSTTCDLFWLSSVFSANRDSYFLPKLILLFPGPSIQEYCNMLNRFISSFVTSPARMAATVEGLAGLGAVGLSHQYQQIRQKSMIKYCGYLEHPEFKKRDIRYKSSTKHDTKRMNWQDYEVIFGYP